MDGGVRGFKRAVCLPIDALCATRLPLDRALCGNEENTRCQFCQRTSIPRVKRSCASVQFIREEACPATLRAPRHCDANSDDRNDGGVGTVLQLERLR